MDLSIDRNEWPEIIRKTKGHLLAYGWPGTGKSHDFSVYAEEMALKKTQILRAADPSAEEVIHEEVNCTRQTSAAGWLGHWIDTGPTGFAWNYGPVARAMMNGVPVVINDVHLCSDDLFDLLFFILDRRKSAKYSLPNGVQLKAEPGFRALLSMNGDPYQVLDEPIRDRLIASYEINVPSAEARKTLDPDVRALCKAMYVKAKKDGPTITFRNFQDFCELRRDLGNVFYAARLACGNEQAARALLEPLLIKGQEED